MNEAMLKKLADQFDALSAQLTAISGTFRSGAGSAEDEVGDAAPAKPVRGKAAKPAATPAAKSKAAEEAITEDEVRTALKELAATKGKDKMADALAEVGAGRLPDVDESDYPALMAKIKELVEEDDAPAAKPAKAAKAKKVAITYEAVEAKFRELVAADKKAAKGVLSEAGLAKLSEVDQDDEGALADLNNAITKALEGEDDDMV